MADVATPSAVDMAIGGNTTEAPKKTRPEKPDEEKFKADLAEAEKAHAKAMERFNAAKAKVEGTGKGKDSPAAKRQQELRAELGTIRQTQSQNKSSRGNVQEKIAGLDTQLKSRINEQKTARARIPYKSAEDVDREIARLEKQVDSGSMKIVDEKKALAEITNLRKLKKSFGGFEESEKAITDLKSQISELKKSMDNPEAKALSERYNTLQKELDELKAEQDSAFKNINALRDERSRLHGEQQETYQAIRKIKDVYYQARNAYRDYETEARKQRAEKQKTEREAYNKEKRKKIATEKLEEASTPAYQDEIISAEGLIRYFDPSTPAEQKVLRGPSGFAAEAQRMVDADAIKGKALSKKEDREDLYFMGGGGKKKKGRKGAASSTPTEGKFNLSIGVIEELGKVGVETPMNQSDVPATLEKLKAKVAQWKAEQDKKTKENVAKAQAEIDRLEAEAAEDQSGTVKPRATDAAKKPALANQGLNGDADADAQLAQEKDADKDVADDLKAAKLEDDA